MKHKVVQGNHIFLTFERYFQNFHFVFDQLCDLLPWQFLVIVNGCPCVFGPGGGGGAVFQAFQSLQKLFKNQQICFKKVF